MSLSTLQHSVEDARNSLVGILKEKDPLLLTFGAFTTGWILSKLWVMHTDDQGLRKRIKRCIFYYARKLPYIRKEIENTIASVRRDLNHSIHKTDSSDQFFSSFPLKSRSADELIAIAEEYSQMEGPPYLEGKVSGAVFNDESDSEEMRMYKEFFSRFAWSNPLWPKLFPGVRKMEAEVVRMCCDLMNGDEESCGTMSTGGTISILLACLAHRNRAMKRGVDFPEMVIPTSAHAAFTKAAEVFRIKPVLIPVDPITYKVDLKKMRSAVNGRTCMLVGSAPNFPFGTHDDIVEIGKMGLHYDIPVHVDACLGGFLLPFLKNARPFDFRVPGVCSISADTHKYGLAPKGSSVVLYRSKEYLHNQYFCDADWQGGIYASSTLEGSRSGVNIALCWASLMFQGREKYTEYAEKIVETVKKIREGLSSIPELSIRGDSDVCIVSWSSDVIDIHRFHSMMEERGWMLCNLQFPSGCHIMVTLNHTHDGIADSIVRDARQVVEKIKANPQTVLEGPAALYGMAQKIPDRSIVQEFAYEYLDACYSKPPRPLTIEMSSVSHK